MGVAFKTLMRKVTGSADPQNNGNGRKGTHVSFLATEAGKAAIARSLQARREGMSVFVTKETLEQLEKLFGARPTNRHMRRLIVEIANGTLKLTTGVVDKTATTSNGNGHETVYTLQQAARALGVKANMLYFRCTKGRINATKDGSRYLIPHSEVERLSRVGL